MASSRARRFLAAALGLAAAALVAELALRALVPRDEGFYVWPPGMRRTFVPLPGVMTGIEGPSRFEVSSVGLRGDEPGPRSKPRILCVGGSTTECLYLDQDEAWPQVLQRELGGAAWVGNAGVSGRHTRDHVVQLEHLLPEVAPLDRVVLLVGVNDLALVLGQGEDYAPAALSDPAERRALLARAFEVLPPDYRDEGFPRSTHLWQALEPFAKRLLRRSATTQDEAGAIYLRWRAHRAGTPRWIDELPDLARALEEYRRNVAELARLCTQAGAPPLFLTQPCLWSAEAPPEHEALFWMGGVGAFQAEPGAPYYTSRALAEGLARFNEALKATCSELEVECLDLAAAVPRDTSAFYDDVHFNEAGARLVAALIAAALR